MKETIIAYMRLYCDQYPISKNFVHLMTTCTYSSGHLSFVFKKLLRTRDDRERETAEFWSVEFFFGTLCLFLLSLLFFPERYKNTNFLMRFQVKFTMDEGTTLADLLSLNLHEFEDEVRNIVDKAVKEMSMEKVSTCKQLSYLPQPY